MSELICPNCNQSVAPTRKKFCSPICAEEYRVKELNKKWQDRPSEKKQKNAWYLNLKNQ